MASKPRPYLKIEPLKELSLVRLLTADEYFAYNVLRLQSWVEEPAGSLPNCPLELARLSGLGAERWEAVAQRVLTYFPEWTPGRRYHKETRAKYEEMCRIANERSDAGRKGGKANAKQTEANAKQLLPTLTHTSTETNTKEPPLPPAGVGSEIVDRIYAAYPKHVDPKDAKAAIAKAVKVIAKAKGLPIADAAEWLYGRVVAYAGSAYVRTKDRQYIPAPARWMNAGKYDDGDGEWSIVAVKATGPTPTARITEGAA